ncbi:Oidioi.mRNA.OKI2018_I69.PAR.g10654.t1.cds [Oikopleura dioica]|uniref:Oidioi.mRNA.OKI2018_I69.PAR.g10654.t1.cds n=1 Tax=Oikopleura dioica TaxID=34765 RepID=A0ABN7RWY9_OIKDI|nr:Oidioi.mRNA.OKI2018_I69.PAR.g10654.t1.cds [Oikopleura dioica]
MTEQSKALSKLLSDHTKLTEQEAKTRAVRVQITKAAFYEHTKTQAQTEEADRLVVEIEDIRKDMATHDKLTDSLIKEIAELEANRDKSLEIKMREPNAKKRSEEENKFYDRWNPSEIESKLRRLIADKMERYSLKGAMFAQIKTRETKITELSQNTAESAAVFKEKDPLTGVESYYMTQVGSTNLPQDEGDSLRDMGKEFRAFVTDAKTQRTFRREKLLKLLGNYKRAMTPEYTERAIIESVVDELIRMPDMTRKDALLSLTPLMRPNVRHQFDRAMTMNTTHPTFKKMIINPCDGSEDWRSERDSKPGRGRRGGHGSGSQSKKQKTDHQSENANPTPEGSGSSGEHWEVAEAMATFNYNEAEIDDVIQHFLDRLLTRPTLKAYAYEKGITTIQDVVASQMKKTLTAKQKRKIKTWCEHRARESAAETLQYPKQAEVVDEPEAIRLWEELMRTNKPKPREAAIAFFICFTTGARMKEALNLRIEDREIVKEEGKEFWRFHIRSSKTDPFCKRMETLTIPMEMKHGVPLALELRAQLRDRDSGLVFKNLEGHTRIASDYLARYGAKAELPKKVSAHSGRVSFYIEGRRSGLSQQTLAHTLRWAPGSSMPDYYERCWLECSNLGAPVSVAKSRARKRNGSNNEDNHLQTPQEPQEAKQEQKKPKTSES